MDLQLESEILIQKLHELKLQKENILSRAYHSIELCRNLLYKLKKEIILHGLNSQEEEIDFFKNIKQVPLVQLIYFSEIHSLEIQFPKADKKAQLKFIKRKIKRLNRFFLYNIDFGQYINSNATHFDKEYYTRNNLDTYYIPTSNFYFQDPDFSTPRDMLLGKFKAYNSIVVYLDKRMSCIINNSNGKTFNHTPTEKITWPFTNSDWVEMVYALWYNGLRNQNGLSIMKVSQKLQEIFDYTPRDIYKTNQDIKGRKNSRTLFLDQLATSLLSEMDKSED
ncbi:RteC domain-containing protein [Salegentibacter sp. F188]|uniref:RteC domain-containing protein n=1 Tax=Autumnicola patrickiae TaxID=3075591 RepID=A0ABU3E5Y4_9FLAO|nr:RteC domain-containing protein [Salegentibacter sp. F188]MDT0691399.1 RteC domain-containing protein [Salegentibacter sp. F188]